MKTAFNRIEIWEVPGHARSEPPALRDRLRGVTWPGNLLVCCFFLGLGTWSTLAPLESAAIAVGTVESEVRAARRSSTSRVASSGKSWSQTVTSSMPVKR